MSQAVLNSLLRGMDTLPGPLLRSFRGILVELIGMPDSLQPQRLKYALFASGR